MHFAEQVELPSNRKFGLFFTFIFTVASAYSYVADLKILCYFFAIAASFLLIVTIFRSEFLYPLNRLWMSFGLLLGKIVSPLVMGLIFFGLFAPISLLTRLFARDELRLKVRKRKSHWRIRQYSRGINDHFKNQF